ASGWPLTCFTTADGALMFASGYIPPRPGTGPGGSGEERSAMVPLLARIADIYAQEAPQLEKQANALAAKLKYDASAGDAAAGGWQSMRKALLANLKNDYDARRGGFGSGDGPRFFEFPAIRLALANGFFGHPDFTNVALDSLKKIAAGGVF